MLIHNMLTFEVISWSDYYPVCYDMWVQNYNEMIEDRRIKFAPSIETYEELEKQGKLLIIMAKQSNIIAGYFVIIINRMTHYSNLMAFDDVYYLAPEYRKGWNGVKLIKFALNELKKLNVEFVMFSSRQIEPILKRLKFRHSDTIHTLWIGN